MNRADVLEHLMPHLASKNAAECILCMLLLFLLIWHQIQFLILKLAFIC